jgi:sigma-B regulation protein RsbU (phosphoserine phosphatase)
MSEDPRPHDSELYLRTLEKKIENFRTVTEISALIASTLELSELMPLVMEKAKAIVEAEACSILFYRKETNTLEFEVALCDDGQVSDTLKKTVTLRVGEGIAGWVAEKKEPLVIEDVSKDGRFYQGADRATGFTTRSMIAVPLMGRSGLIGVAEIINPRRLDYDPELFLLLCRQFAIAIENARFHRESLERERLRHELEIAATLQQSFLPPHPRFSRGRVRLAAVNIAAAKVGGDLYDFLDLDEGRAAFFIGDVSGKGISAALYMAKVISDFRHCALHGDSPEKVLNALNLKLQHAPMGMFVTGVYGIVDVLRGTATLSAAGSPPFLLLAHSAVTLIDISSGPPLGIMPFDYTASDFTLGEGDGALFITDGVFDAKDREGNRLGLEKIVDFARRHRADRDLPDLIAAHVRSLSGKERQTDDLTMVELRLVH